MERVSFVRHIHSHDHQTPSQFVTLDDIKRRYQQVDAVVIEDHGEFKPSKMPQGSIPGPLLLHGNEWATPIHPGGRPDIKHHVGMLGVDEREQKTLQIQGTDPPHVQQKKIHLAGGVMVMNHPEWPYIVQDAYRNKRDQVLDYTFPVNEAKHFDAIELFNDAGFQGNNALDVLHWVERVFYQRGLFPAMVGGQDDHGPSVIAKNPAYTLAIATDKSEDAILAAIRERRTYVSRSADAQLEIRMDGQSMWESAPRLGQELTVTLSGVPDGLRVELVKNGQVVATSSVQQGQTTLSWLPPRSTRQGDYVYVRALTPEGELHTASSAFPLPFSTPGKIKAMVSLAAGFWNDLRRYTAIR